MISSSAFKPDGKYSFEVYPAALLPTDFSNITVLGVINERLARKFIATRELHANYYPMLPEGTPNDATAYSYLHIMLATGVETVVGLAWIKPDSVKSTTWNTYDVTVQTSDPDAANRIRLALVSNNFNDIEIKARAT